MSWISPGVRHFRSFAPFLLGFALMTLAGMVLRASPVMAQQTWNDLTIARPTTRRQRLAPSLSRGHL